MRSSIAGGAKTCYAVTAVVDGKPVNGYVLGNALPAVVDFERARQAAERASERAAEQARQVPAPVAQPEKPRLPVFRDFSARDMKGKPVSLSGLSGKLILVCFWTPRNDDSQRELILVSQLFGQFRRQGLDAVGISLSSNTEMINGSLEDFGVAFPNIPGDYGLAERYGVAFETLPRTYVLNEKHEILATGIHGKELERAIQSLVKGER